MSCDTRRRTWPRYSLKNIPAKFQKYFSRYRMDTLGHMDGWRDGRTGRWTDGQTDSHADGDRQRKYPFGLKAKGQKQFHYYEAGPTQSVQYYQTGQTTTTTRKTTATAKNKNKKQQKKNPDTIVLKPLFINYNKYSNFTEYGLNTIGTNYNAHHFSFGQLYNQLFGINIGYKWAYKAIEFQKNENKRLVKSTKNLIMPHFDIFRSHTFSLVSGPIRF